MDARTRMFRVLGTLVVSMLGGSALLWWLEPSVLHPPEALSAEQSRRQAAAAVASANDLRENWRAIRLRFVDSASSRDFVRLAATESGNSVHFLVSDTGSVQACSSWRRQDPINDEAHIRIGLAQPAPDATQPRAQVEALRALVDALNAAVRPSSLREGLPVRVDSGQGPTGVRWLTLLGAVNPD